LSLFVELKRRNVLRIAGLYLVGAWLIVQVAGTVLPMFDAAAWLPRTIVVVLAIGFIPALVFAWVFEITPEGLKRESEVDRNQSQTLHTGKTLDRVIMVVLALALGYFAFDKFVLSESREVTIAEEAHQAGRREALVLSYGEKSIAVLPFVDMSPDKDQEYMSDGIAEELLNLLAKIPELRVISRSSAFSFKGQNLDIPEIGKRLNVAHILEGSVRKAGNQVRITAQLIEARSDTHLWSETYDRPLDDIFAVQDEIAGAVVAQLKLKLLDPVPKVEATDPKAYMLYLRANQLYGQITREGYEQSIELYQQALAIDPNYAAAWDGLASSYCQQAEEGLRRPEEAYRLAREAVNKALAIDPDYAPAYATLGLIAQSYDGDLKAAAGYMEHALALQPNLIGGAPSLALSLGRCDTAITMYEYILARNPLSSHHDLGLAYLCAGRLDEAVASLRTALSIRPGAAGFHAHLGMALLLKGDYPGALAAIQKESSEVWRMIFLPMAYYALGRKAESDAALAELIRKFEKEAAGNIADVLAYRGEADRAFEWLDKEIAYNGPAMSEVACDPLLANLHKDPRWLPFLESIGKSPAQLDAIEFKVTLPE
jgi:TolB-like protein/Tfp pilus assembly protein PilF